MLNEVLCGLDIKPTDICVDATLGGGGHAEQIAMRCKTLIGFDKDADAILECKKRLKNFDNIIYIQADFSNAKKEFERLGIKSVDKILLDLGVSSHQIDTPERGFSFRFDGPLDMRMNKNQNFTAKELVNTFSKERIGKILWEYGEEEYAPIIAENIIKARKKKQIETTFELKEIVDKSLPAKVRFAGGNKKTFQAIRIAVNGELAHLEKTLKFFAQSLSSGGRIAVLTFHSLEEKQVTNAFMPLLKNEINNKNLALQNSVYKYLTNQVITPTPQEKQNNPRSSCSKLRILQKN